MPTDLKGFLLYLIAEPVGLGVLTAAGLQALFNWWEGSAQEPWHAPIRSHDKTLVSSVVPLAVAFAAYGLLAALGWQAWSWQAAAQATFNGFLAVVGGQWAFGALRKLTTPPSSVVTNIGTVTAGQDAFVGSSQTLAAPPSAVPGVRNYIGPDDYQESK
jgi:hypothetical protein